MSSVTEASWRFAFVVCGAGPRERSDVERRVPVGDDVAEVLVARESATLARVEEASLDPPREHVGEVEDPKHRLGGTGAEGAVVASEKLDHAARLEDVGTPAELTSSSRRRGE